MFIYCGVPCEGCFTEFMRHSVHSCSHKCNKLRLHLIFTLHILHVQETKLTWDHRNENYTSTILFKQTKKEIRPDTLRHQKFTNHTFWKCRSYDVELKQMTHFITSSSPGYCVVYRLRFREVHYSGLELARHLHMLISSDLQSTRKKIQLTIK